MKKIIGFIWLITLWSSTIAQDNKRPSGTIESVTDDLARVVNKEARVEIVAEGFQFTEGPLWIEKEKMLLLSDIPGNTIYKWTEARGKEVYVKPGGYTDSVKRGGFMGPNGMILAPDGKIWVCQHGDRRIASINGSITSPTATFTTIVGEYEGKRLNSPNDLFLSKTGDLYFTDPAYGFEKGPNDPKKELTFQGVYKRSPAGKVTLLIDSLEAPNGISIMPDGKTLIVSNSDPRNRRWYAYQLKADGTIEKGKVLYDAGGEQAPGLCDGLKIDKKGNLFAAGPGGVWIFDPKGKLIGKIRLEGVTASNCGLTPDNKVLFITAGQYLLRVKLK